MSSSKDILFNSAKIGTFDF